jgi:hypothetical protein
MSKCTFIHTYTHIEYNLTDVVDDLKRFLASSLISSVAKAAKLQSYLEGGSFLHLFIETYFAIYVFICMNMYTYIHT